MRTGSDIAHRLTQRLNRDATRIYNRYLNRPNFVGASESNLGQFHVLRPSEQFEMWRPPNFDDTQWRIFSSAVKSRVPEARLLDAPNITILGYDSWPFTSDGRAIVDLWDQQGALSERDRLVLMGRPSNDHRATSQHLKGTTVLLNQVVAGNYYHFVHQIMPRLALVSQHVRLDTIDHFVLPQNVTGFMRAWLALAGIEEDRIRPMTTEGYTCDRAIATSNPGPHNVAPIWSIDYLRGLVPDTSADDVPRRVFLSRQDAPARKLLNHNAIEALLKSYGFELVLPGKLSIAQQAALFRHAETMVSVHGAALANLVFAHPKLKLIELLPNNHIQPTFWTLGQQLGLDHQILVGEEAPLRFERLRRDTKADLSISADKLEALLIESGLERV